MLFGCVLLGLVICVYDMVVLYVITIVCWVGWLGVVWLGLVVVGGWFWVLGLFVVGLFCCLYGRYWFVLICFWFVCFDMFWLVGLGLWVCLDLLLGYCCVCFNDLLLCLCWIGFLWLLFISW